MYKVDTLLVSRRYKSEILDPKKCLYMLQCHKKLHAKIGLRNEKVFEIIDLLGQLCSMGQCRYWHYFTVILLQHWLDQTKKIKKQVLSEYTSTYLLSYMIDY